MQNTHAIKFFIQNIFELLSKINLKSLKTQKYFKKPNEKWARDLNRYLTIENIERKNKYIKMLSIIIF